MSRLCHTSRFILGALALMCAVVLVNSSEASAAGDVWYVDEDALGGGTGTSWVSPFTDLQVALAAASSGDEIWVAEGEYTPGTSRSDTFTVPSGLTILGGFQNGDTIFDRDPMANETTLLGEIGVPADVADNSYNIITIDNSVTTATVDGFTIRGAHADGSGDQLGGGGIRIEGGDITLANLVLSENYALVEGSAVLVTGTAGASATMTDSSVTDNVGSSIVHVQVGESLELRRVEFIDNTGTFTDNGSISYTSPSRAVSANGTLTMVDSQVIGQRGLTIFQGSGALSIAGATATIVNTQIIDNIGGPGAGIRADARGGPFGADTNLTLTNVVIANNHAQATAGGGIHSSGSNNGVDEWTVDITADNVTMADNHSNFCCPANVGSELYFDAALNIAGTDTLVNATFDNSIVWNTHESTPGVPNSLYDTTPLPATWRNSIVVQSGGSGGGWNSDVGVDGGGNLEEDPLFVDAIFGIGQRDVDHRLKSGSPAISAGDNALLPSDVGDMDEDTDVSEIIPFDLDGAARIQGFSSDVGAFERGSVFDGLAVLGEPCVVYDSKSATDTQLDGRILGDEVRTVQVSGLLTGQGGVSSCVPDGASAAIFRISSIDPITEGNLLMTPEGVPSTGEAGVVNYGDMNGLDNANTVTIPLSGGGAVDIEANTGPAGAVQTTDVRLVVIGYYSRDVDPDLKFFSVNPCAVVDSRVNQGAGNAFNGPNDDGFWPVGSAFPDIDVVGTFDPDQGGGNGLTGCGVPTGADHVMLNVVAVNATGGSGHLSVAPGGTNPVDEATTPFAVLAPKMNNGATTIVPLNGGQTIALDVDGVAASTMIRVEVLGYFDDDVAGLDYTAVTPCAVFDSRTNQGADGTFAGERKHGPAHTTVYEVTGSDISIDQGGVVEDPPASGSGSCGVPNGASAVLINLEGVNALIEGNFWVSAAGTTTTGGVLNFNNVLPKMNNANTVVVPISPEGELALEVNAGSFTTPGTSVAHARGVIFGYYS